MYGPSRFSEGRAFKTKGKVLLDTDRPRTGNNIFIFLLSFTNENQTVCRDVHAEHGFPSRNPINVTYGSKIDNLRYKPRKWCQVMS